MRYWRIVLILGLFLPIMVFADTFTRDLYFGMRGDQDVVKLQQFLKAKGYYTGPASGYYGPLTIEGVKKFQKANGINPIGGYFGPRSREVANTLVEAGNATSGGSGGWSFSGTWQDPGKFLGGTGGGSAGGTAGGTTSLAPGISPYRGKVRIAGVAGGGSDPRYENIIIANQSGEKVIVSGFQVQNARGETLIVPRGYELPGLLSVDLPKDLITLNPGNTATITVGGNARGMNFRENICTGYFSETTEFIPGIQHACPRFNPRGLFTYLSDQCLNLLSSTPSCRQVDSSQIFDDNCSRLSQEHYNYAGCLKDFRNASNFFLSNWMIWMQRDKPFFRDLIERVTLRDQNGLLVDQYEY